MRKYSILLLVFISSLAGFFFAFSSSTNASCLFNWSQAGCSQEKIPYCTDGDCSLSGGLDAAERAINGSGINTQDNASTFVTTLVQSFLAFVTLVAVIYVLWAGFQIMISGSDDEKVKKARKTIIYVIIGIVVMWLAYAIVILVIQTLTSSSNNRKVTIQYEPRTFISSMVSIGSEIIPGANAATYNDSAYDTFLEYKDKIRIAIQDIESEFKVNNSVDPIHLSNVKTLVQEAFNRLPDFGDEGTQNDMMKRAVDRDIDVAIRNPKSSSQVGIAVSTTATFINSAKINTIQGSIRTSATEGNAPLTVSFEASNIKDPSGTTPDQGNYIWWIRENGGVRRELGRGKNLIKTFDQEGTYTIFLDVVSGSRNSKGKIDVLPLSTSTTIDVKPSRGEVTLLINGVNVANLDSLKINPSLGKMGIILDATASRATAGTITETSWNFGNGESLTYKGGPIIERAIYANDGQYPVSLTLKTNNGETFSKDIQLIVRNPSAVIETDKTVGNVGDEMYFSSLSYFTNVPNIQYSWEIQDENNKKIASNIAGNTLRFTFDKVGTYILTLTARSPNGEIDTDSKKITIESREPVITLESPKVVSTEQPNIFVFDASKSYDPDTMSKNGLSYTWRIDGTKVNLDNVSNNGAKGTYTFDSVGNHIVSLTIANSYGKVATEDQNFQVTSLLSANILITPRVAPIGSIINFIGQAPNANFFQWNMGDGSPVVSGSKKIVQYSYKKTGVYNVVMTVSNANNTESNQVSRRIYVTDAGAPFAMISVSNGSNTAYYDNTACGSGATVVNRSETTTFDGQKSINIDGSNSDLTYTWNYFGKTSTNPSITEKLGEIGCYPIKLTVRSSKNGAVHSTTEYISIKNQPPEVTNISTSVDSTKKDSQKVLVKVTANGAVDPDGVITSYIWYYTTESDPEPQNIQITQKPDITFVLPNITEKYYFGVILEDNDGARINSMSNGAKNPLILDNQNGNIYMPLITLTTPKNTVLVDEPVQMSVEAKTIVGTNITKNAEYAWDFDGDGRYDERTQNPAITYTYKNSGTYSLKVRVTYNGVSNTKYATVYVKNPLKANAQGYVLPDGSLYFLNTSAGSYSTTYWDISNGTRIESPYSLTLSPEQAQALSGNSEIGVLRIISDSSETSSFSLTHSGLTTLVNTPENINYQSSPRAIDDVIHVSGPGEKILLSFMGNAGNKYIIDSDTNIDSNLDGIPDNDTDNQGSTSYNDGSVFVIGDTGDVHIRNRTARVSVYSGNQLIGSKDIRIIFDFIPESSTVSGEDLLQGDAGSMSDFDREKLDALAALIRESENNDRIILMNLYNTMIENWDDTFSKSKSLIDIQGAIDTTSLPEEKKAAMTQLIDELLTGNATAVDDVTLASKLVEGLIPQSSPNRTAILEKLTAIKSHPDSYEENKALATEILDLIKDDSTIEDKYKLDIKNQLRVIISGGQVNIPDDTTSSSSGGFWSSFLGFISGVVWVFLYILGGILIVVLIGYIFYLIGRKDKEIGFQDFLIDSVFHAKRSPKKEIATADGTNLVVNTDQAPPIVVTPVEVSPSEKDPLATFTPPQSQEVEKKDFQETPPVKDPLATVNINVETTPTQNDTVAPSDGGIPSWLQIPKDDTVSSTSWETSAPEEIQVQTDNTPIADTPEISEDGNILTNEVSTDKKTSPESETPVQEQDSTPIEPSSSELPDWLVDSIKNEEPADLLTEPMTEPKEEMKEEVVKIDTQKKEKNLKKKGTTEKDGGKKDTPPKTDADIPDWLK